MTTNKTRRPAKGRSAANPSNYSQLYKQSEQNQMQAAIRTAEAASSASFSSVTQRASSVEADWRAEYGFVFNDLRRLLVISAALFAAIILIGFFL
ncbi:MULTISPECIES: hypothetical protein [Caldilinea]|jgi:hypothetical protein|uniref:Uncharacterized protein n=1 Tax=Caldilinea aerophila (strain DSM 14535 / JCM 11387 / NBRC 104270 / STL-6-O1) TaxID=926550 RepID=I0I3G3_CALAS|nr:MULTISPECIES: hypothetical protein [Caldilinea]MBO9394536.1 hypothetical protein [Caldilinea sp.]BAL99800.1 hypothetical protein CLDAP_17610 [Caldilinea aerophila DSM 14535 = NBRC 104270]GIV73601.1 MAG: hypothetical protein KatS3mg049_2157 [Caldilinea sp.]